MSLKLNVGINKKIGQPHYGSLGASCNVEVELDQSLVFDDVEAFQERVSHAYAACRHAVTEELARQQGETGEGSAHANQRQLNGHTIGHQASQRQLDYARQLAGQIRGLGENKLEALSAEMFGKPLAELSSLDASGLIDMLKQIKVGTIDPSTVLNGAAA